MLRRRHGCRLRGVRVDKNLYGVLWQRTIHSGESVSRFVDFAIRVFMPRFVEMYLHKPQRWPPCQRLSAARRVPTSPRRGSAFSARNHHFWAARWQEVTRYAADTACTELVEVLSSLRRARYTLRKSFPDYFINYQKVTEKNENGGLETAQKAVLIAKKDLSYAEYIHCLRTCI